MLFQAQDLVHVFPAPSGERFSDLFKVAVEGQPSPVYVAHVVSMTGADLKEYINGKASFTTFDISGPVKILVTYAQPRMKKTFVDIL